MNNHNSRIGNNVYSVAVMKKKVFIAHSCEKTHLEKKKKANKSLEPSLKFIV